MHIRVKSAALAAAVFDLPKKKDKGKVFHTRYRALGPELIPVYKQSARR